MSQLGALQQYYPLTGTTFWLDYQLWQFWPLPYHVENVLLHATAALLFWRVLRTLEVPGAWLAAAIFALHPMMVESAAWVSERKDVLSVCFYLAALLAYLRYAPNEPRQPLSPAVRWAGRGWYFLALALFALALLSKTTACSLPAAVLLLRWWRRGELEWRRDVLPTLPFFAPAIAMCAVTGWIEKYRAGAQGEAFALTFAQRFLIAGRAFWFYLSKLIFPTNLCFVYPRWSARPEDLTQWLYPVAAAGAFLALWLGRTKIGRGPVVALLFFAGAIAPLLGFVDLYFMRYSFVCTIGPTCRAWARSRSSRPGSLPSPPVRGASLRHSIRGGRRAVAHLRQPDLARGRQLQRLGVTLEGNHRAKPRLLARLQQLGKRFVQEGQHR